MDLRHRDLESEKILVHYPRRLSSRAVSFLTVRALGAKMTAKDAAAIMVTGAGAGGHGEDFTLLFNMLISVKPQLAYVFLCASFIAGCASTPDRAPAINGQSDPTKTTPHDQGDRESTIAPVSAGPGDVFAGTDRRDAKTTLASAGVEAYPLVTTLRSTLRTDQYMLSLGISKAPDSARFDDEKRNVTVGGFIYATKKESDNDFHLIVGDQHCAVGSCLMTVEVSGIPSLASNPYRKTLADVRSKFLSRFNGSEPSARYTKFDPPIHVTLTGSLFFDVDHKAGTVGPAGLQPDTAWEMHPLSDITYEP